MRFSPQEIKLAEQLVETLSKEFHLEKYHDECEDRLKALIEAKQKGEEIAVPAASKRAPVIDMMTALKRSLETTAARKKPMRPKEAAAQKKAASESRARFILAMMTNEARTNTWRRVHEQPLQR